MQCQCQMEARCSNVSTRLVSPCCSNPHPTQYPRPSQHKSTCRHVQPSPAPCLVTPAHIGLPAQMSICCSLSPHHTHSPTQSHLTPTHPDPPAHMSCSSRISCSASSSCLQSSPDLMIAPRSSQPGAWPYGDAAAVRAQVLDHLGRQHADTTHRHKEQRQQHTRTAHIQTDRGGE